MHEMGLADAMMKTVDRIVKNEGDVVVRSITVELGDLSGVVPRFLSECWEAVADGTELEKTEFVIEELAGTARCMDCGEQFIADLNDLSCPACKGKKLLPLTGRDLTLKEILAP